MQYISPEDRLLLATTEAGKRFVHDVEAGKFNVDYKVWDRRDPNFDPDRVPGRDLKQASDDWEYNIGFQGVTWGDFIKWKEHGRPTKPSWGESLKEMFFMMPSHGEINIPYSPPAKSTLSEYEYFAKHEKILNEMWEAESVGKTRSQAQDMWPDKIPSPTFTEWIGDKNTVFDYDPKLHKWREYLTSEQVLGKPKSEWLTISPQRAPGNVEMPTGYHGEFYMQNPSFPPRTQQHRPQQEHIDDPRFFIPRSRPTEY
jgi:hypothetical protein